MVPQLDLPIYRTARLRIVTTLPQDRLGNCGAAARAIEALGYSGVYTLENRHDPFLPLALAATTTSHLELATGVAIAFLRSPMSVAHIGWDLHQASGGRFVLGLGPQIKAHNEKRFSVPWSAPVPRMREYVQALRAIWRTWRTGEPLRYAGEHYRFSLMPPNFVPPGSGLAPPAVTLAAVGPGMVRLAGEVADGIRLHPFNTRRYFETVIAPELARGFALSGKSRAHFEINGGGFIATGPDDVSVHERAEWVRYRIGFYASTPAYWPVLEAEGLHDLGPRLNALTKQGRWDALAREVPDDLLHACAAIGRHDEIAAVIERRFAGLTDTLAASASAEQTADLPPDLIQDLIRLPSAFRAFATD